MAATTVQTGWWSNYDAMVQVLDLICCHANGLPAVLILDQYGVHTTRQLREEARYRHIHLVFVPGGMTSLLQPLDVGVLGPLKATANRLLYEQLHDDPDRIHKPADKAELLDQALAELQSTTVRSAFDRVIQQNVTH